MLDANGKLIELMTVAEARAGIESGVISGGMIPKVETAIAAVEGRVEGVVILDGRRPHAMLMELFTPHGHGTLIYDPSGLEGAPCAKLAERRWRAAAHSAKRA